MPKWTYGQRLLIDENILFVGIFPSIIVFIMFGYSALIILIQCALVMVFREAYLVPRGLKYAFARKTAFLSAAISSGFFFVLVVNGLAITRYGHPFILPEIPVLTLFTSSFVLLGLFVCRYIRLLYCPYVPPD